MRQNQKSNRPRGRGRRPGGQNQPHINRNTTFDSNGPEGRLRGNAQQLFDKYTALAHDANAAGERVSAEAFSQFADHYYRVSQSIIQAAEQRRANEPRHNGRAMEETGEGMPEDADGARDSAKPDDDAAETGQPLASGSDKAEDGDDNSVANAVA